jgi:hypothetical protein
MPAERMTAEMTATGWKRPGAVRCSVGLMPGAPQAHGIKPRWGEVMLVWLLQAIIASGGVASGDPPVYKRVILNYGHP